MAIGNVVGSNISNIQLILGSSALVAPLRAGSTNDCGAADHPDRRADDDRGGGERDIAVGNTVGSNRFNVLAVLGLTSVFSPGGVAVPLKAAHHETLPYFSGVVLWFVIPLTTVTVLTILFRERRTAIVR